MARVKKEKAVKVVKKTITIWGVDNLSKVIKDLPNLVPGLQVKAWKKVGRGPSKKVVDVVTETPSDVTEPVLASQV